MVWRARLTTISAVAWTPSRTADSCPFPPEEFFHPCPAISLAITDPATTTFGITSMPNMSIELPVKVKSHELGYALNGWQLSGTVFWHSGVPFTVLSTPYSANGNGIVQGGGPQFASVVPGVPLYEHNPIPGVTQPGYGSVAQSQCFRLGGRSQHGSLLRRRSSPELPVRKSWPQRPARP